jgi:hypothetical protein
VIDYSMTMYTDHWKCFSNGCKMMMLSNLTHIRSKGAMHIKKNIEGEVWQSLCHNLLALASSIEL